MLSLPMESNWDSPVLSGVCLKARQFQKKQNLLIFESNAIVSKIISVPCLLVKKENFWPSNHIFIFFPSSFEQPVGIWLVIRPLLCVLACECCFAGTKYIYTIVLDISTALWVLIAGKFFIFHNQLLTGT